MVKETVSSKGAAALRRSAIAERLRLREEWSSLKGTDDENDPPAKVKKKQTIFSKKLHIKKSSKIPTWNSTSRRNKENARPHSSTDALRGVVALVDVGAEGRGLALRAALSALGASVVQAWSPLVTHLVWSQGGSRDTRARARALACRVVSPLWVEACASAARRVSEKVFPSTARDSDLPSPATLCRLLKTAEKENWQIPGLQAVESDSDDDGRQTRLRISSDKDDSTSKAGQAKDSVDIESRVNTAPRRALPVSMSPHNPRSRRKLFTARADGDDDTDAEDTPVPIRKAKPQTEKGPNRPHTARPGKEGVPHRAPERQKKVKKYNLTQEQKRNLENAGRMAKKLAVDPVRRVESTQRRISSSVPRIVLSGMPKSQYQAVMTAIQTLKGIVQRTVDHCTTHVLLGTCKEDPIDNENAPKPQQKTNTPQRSTSKSSNPVKPFSICNQCNSPEGLVMKMFECDNVEVTNHCSNPANISDKDVTIICSTVNRNSNVNNGDENVINDAEIHDNDISDMCNGITNDKRLRTLKTLLGAARGCRVLHAQWALDSLKEKKWLPHVGYEVTYLLKIAQKARVERFAIEKIRSEYGYNVFRGIRVCLTETADQRDAAMQLLSLCGAEIIHEDDIQRDIQNNNAVLGDKTTQNGVRTQNGGLTQNGGNSNCATVVIGKADEEFSSKWVFDSVAAGRPRTTRRYINKNIIILQE